jgi:hypothetical protein
VVQYSAEESRQLMVMSGYRRNERIFITPVEETFRRITPEDVVDILEQVSLK